MEYNVALTSKQLHKLLKERDDLRADLKAVAVAADNHLLLGTLETHEVLVEALARPGVQEALKDD